MLLVLFALAATSLAHMRFDHPKPRLMDTGVKEGPCGVASSAEHPVTTLAPGKNVLVFYEDIAHSGAPMRIAISKGNDDGFEDHVLDSHIPHNDAISGFVGLTSYYYSIVVDIPDVKCDNCVLQIISVMTDKIRKNSCCSYPIDSFYKCFSVYHSCANIKINGTGAELPAGLPKAQTQYFTKDEGTETAFVENKQTQVWELTGSYPKYNPASCECDANKCNFVAGKSGGTVEPPARSNLPAPPAAAASSASLAVCAAALAAIALRV